jgi:hypothetical protein
MLDPYLPCRRLITLKCLEDMLIRVLVLAGRLLMRHPHPAPHPAYAHCHR